MNAPACRCRSVSLSPCADTTGHRSTSTSPTCTTKSGCWLDRDAALAEAGTLARLLESTRAETGDLRARLDRVVRTPADPAAVGDRVQRMLELARAEADTIVAAAHERAGAILRHATTTERRTAAPPAGGGFSRRQPKSVSPGKKSCW